MIVEFAKYSYVLKFDKDNINKFIFFINKLVLFTEVKGFETNINIKVIEIYLNDIDPNFALSESISRWYQYTFYQTNRPQYYNDSGNIHSEFLSMDELFTRRPDLVIDIYDRLRNVKKYKKLQELLEPLKDDIELYRTVSKYNI